MNTLIILITHAPTASAFREALESMRFPYDKNTLFYFDIHNATNPKEMTENIHQRIQHYKGQSILILTDLIGSTPFHIAKQVSAKQTTKAVRLVTGINLPMLLKAINYQLLSAEELSMKVLMGATESIVIN